MDNILHEYSTQAETYHTCGASIVDSILQGYDGTIFSYGETKSGKTFSINGLQDYWINVTTRNSKCTVSNSNDEEELYGIIPRTGKHLFDSIHVAERRSNEAIVFEVNVSFLQVYNERVYDLLRLEKYMTPQVKLREKPYTGVYVEGLTYMPVTCYDSFLTVLRIGSRHLAIQTTHMGQCTARAHSIFTVELMCTTVSTGMKRTSRLQLIDMAGSESVPMVQGISQLKEGQCISKSLNNLGSIINALVTPGVKFVPYRNSVLTRLMREALGGRARCVMLATVRATAVAFDETVSTLLFASKVQMIKNYPVVQQFDAPDVSIRDDAVLDKSVDNVKDLKSQEGISTYLTDAPSASISSRTNPDQFDGLDHKKVD